MVLVHCHVEKRYLPRYEGGAKEAVVATKKGKDTFSGRAGLLMVKTLSATQLAEYLVLVRITVHNLLLHMGMTLVPVFKKAIYL